MCIVWIAKLQRFCQLGSGIIALDIRRMPYLYRNDDSVEWNLQEYPLTNVTVVFGCIAQSRIIIDKKQDAQLSQRDRAAGCVIVFAKSRTLERGDNDLRIL